MTTTTTPWRNVVTPHDNIKQGKVKQNDFAASLADVLNKNGNPDYFDPVRFFNRTFLTDGLRQLATEVVGRLSGQGDGDAVIQIQTPFGGGKTHTLITLYHLVKNGPACSDHPALKDYYWFGHGSKEQPSVPVAAFDGNQVGVGAVELEPGLSVQTMWGHLAWQLAGKAGYEVVRTFDADRVSPDGNDIDKLLKLSKGGLIILDEVANYVETAAAVTVADSTLAAQTRTFLQRLTTRAGQHERVIVVATLPRSDGTQTHGTASLQVLQALQELFGRVQKVREPVQGDEVHEIIRRRLFVPFGQDTDDKGTRTKKANSRDATIHAYIADLKARPQVPDSAKEHDYAERFKKSYPFHPSLLDILNLVGANSKLQRTRGVLRVLALLVADLLKKNHNGGLIQASDIDLTNETLRSELLELVDREFRSALEADIIGATANAPILDKQSPLMTQWRVAAGLAATTFLYTCEAGNSSRGATPAELHLASARPEIDFGTIPGVVLQLKERFHFINTDGERFRFSTTPNLNRILLDAKNGVDDEQVRERLCAELRKLLSATPLSPYVWPESSGDIADSASNKLVVMPPERTLGGTNQDKTHAAVLEILNKSGAATRTRRNTLVFLVADAGEVAALKERVRALLAAENVDTNRERHNLSKTQITQLQTEKTNAAKGVRQQILRAYRHAAWGGSNGDPLKILDMGQPPATLDQNLTDLVVAFLKDKQKYLEQIAPILLVHPKKLKVWPEEEHALSLKALPNYFRQFTHLPILRDDEVLKQSIAEGVSMGTFALCEGTTAEDAKVLYYKDKIVATGIALADGHLLIRGALADQKLAEQKAKGPGGTALGTGPVGGVNVIAQPGGLIGVGSTAGGMSLGGGTTTVTGTGSSTKPVPGATSKKIRRVTLDVEVPFTDFHTFTTGIVNALGRNADNIKIVVKVEAAAENGFNPTVIEDTVKETLFNLFRSDDLLKLEEE